jgi:putative PIN family toxin of toxin-antitoxin system
VPARKKRTLVVIDTNVMVSAALGGEARQVVNQWKFGFLQLVVSEEIVKEYLAVLARFDLTDAQMRHWTRWFTHPSKVTEVHPPLRVTVSRDPQDNCFLEAAVTGRAKYLITRDQDLLVLQEFEEVAILTPGAFLAVWQPRKRKRKASQ